MKWKWVCVAIGGTFLVYMVEKGRTNALISEAIQIREATKKPILLISSNRRQGFDAYINPSETIVWQLPYANKAFGAVMSDSLEEIQYPKEAVAEWQRIADSVLINTHSVFSPEAWLDFRHQYVFVGQNTIPINPSLNWAIGGGLAYYLYRRQQRKKLAKSTVKALPETEIIEEGEELPTTEDIVEEIAEDLPSERKMLPAPTDGNEGGVALETERSEGVKVEPAPIINPDDLEGESVDMLDGIDLSDGVNLGIGSDGVFAEKLQAKGVTNLIFNPASMPQEHNQAVLNQLEAKPADSATLIDVLSKIKDSEERQGAVQIAYENIKSGGKIFVKDKTLKKYLPEIKQRFPDAKIKGGIIVATK